MIDTKEEILAHILEHENKMKEYDQYLENHKRLRIEWKRVISTDLNALSKRMKEIFYGKIKIPVSSVREAPEIGGVSFPFRSLITLGILSIETYLDNYQIKSENNTLFVIVKVGGVCFDVGRCYVILRDTDNEFIGTISIEDFYEKVAPFIQVEEK
jgi:hypothetical protein